MCGPKTPKDNSAKLARREEEARQQRIAEGRAAIDDAFAGFDDGYFNKVRDDYAGYYMPQLADQYEDARRALMLRLAGSGNLGSSAGGNQLAELEKRYSQERAAVADRALDAANQHRATVLRDKQFLYDQNMASADPSQAAVSAAAAIGALQQPQTYSPLVGVFADLLGSVGTGVAAERQGYRGFNTGLFGPGRNRSSRIVEG